VRAFPFRSPFAGALYDTCVHQDSGDRPQCHGEVIVLHGKVNLTLCNLFRGEPCEQLAMERRFDLSASRQDAK